MNLIVKLSAILVYLLGFAALAGLLPDSLSFLWTLTWVLFVLHVLEAVLMFKVIRRYPGGLAMSLVLTLLFGFVHWLPLRKLPDAN